MKIEGTCRSCDRDVTGDQMVHGGGTCPWCGVAFSTDYAVTFVNAVREAQEAGTRLEAALEVLADLGPAVRISENAVLADTRRHLARIERPALRQA
ncbi:MAG: hypothetical protein WD096_08235 [Actinomycetota bacterium]